MALISCHQMVLCCPLSIVTWGTVTGVGREKVKLEASLLRHTEMLAWGWQLVREKGEPPPPCRQHDQDCLQGHSHSACPLDFLLSLFYRSFKHLRGLCHRKAWGHWDLESGMEVGAKFEQFVVYLCVFSVLGFVCVIECLLVYIVMMEIEPRVFTGTPRLCCNKSEMFSTRLVIQ